MDLPPLPVDENLIEGMPLMFEDEDCSAEWSEGGYSMLDCSGYTEDGEADRMMPLGKNLVDDRGASRSPLVERSNSGSRSALRQRRRRMPAPEALSPADTESSISDGEDRRISAAMDSMHISARRSR